MRAHRFRHALAPCATAFPPLGPGPQEAAGTRPRIASWSGRSTSCRPRLRGGSTPSGRPRQARRPLFRWLPVADAGTARASRIGSRPCGFHKSAAIGPGGPRPSDVAGGHQDVVPGAVPATGPPSAANGPCGGFLRHQRERFSPTPNSRRAARPYLLVVLTSRSRDLH